MSAGEIPFLKDMTFEYAVAEQVTPLIRRVVARNPGPFTFHGTNSYIVGHGEVAVIDPGPLIDEHIAALTDALASETVIDIVITHTHHDHSPASVPLKGAVGGTISGRLPRPLLTDAQTIESVDHAFAPDRVLEDGDKIEGPGWTLEAVTTPGHMSNHVCFALAQENVLFTGDHIMGWNTTVVSPPDGNMTEYMASLDRCLARDDSAYWPGHGPHIPDLLPFVGTYRAHRLMREEEILACLKADIKTIPAMVQRMYQHIPPTMHGVAGRSVLAHLEHMVETGRARSDGTVTAEAHYRLP